MTMQEYIVKHQLAMTATRVPFRLDVDCWEGATHYACVVTQVGRGPAKTFNCFYSMGSAHKGFPKLPDVIDSIASDSTAQGQSFEDWCDDCGYEADSIKALATYNACKSNGGRLVAFLGFAAFNELINDVERL